MPLRDEAQHGHRDVGMADGCAERPFARPRGAIPLQRGQSRPDLRATTLDPQIERLLMQPLLVEHARRLVGEAVFAGALRHCARDHGRAD